MTRLITTIDVSGPFFTRDVTQTFRANVRAMLQAMAEEGAEDVRAQIEAHEGDMPRSVGWSRTRVAVRSHFPWREGRGYSLLWTSTQGMGKKEAVRTMAAMSTIEGRWHPFRVTKNRLNKSKAVNYAELTKGLE